MRRFTTSSTIAAGFSALTLILSGGAALAETDERPVMPLGAATAPPAGFLALCERSPEECLGVGAVDADQAEGLRAWAGRTRWAAVFQSAGLTAPIEAPASVIAAVAPEAAPAADKPRPTIAERRAAKDARRKAGRSPKAERKAAKTPKIDADAQSTVMVPATTVAEPATVEPRQRVATASFAALQQVNRRVNRSIRRATDQAAYGVDDLWAVPEGEGGRGDCEDYVLAKRRALVALGVDPSALSIALVRTRRGEMHAVLLVATADGELVLDNLSPWVVGWAEAPYEWLDRQAPGEPLVWVRAAA